jgi:hypothetical protein
MTQKLKILSLSGLALLTMATYTSAGASAAEFHSELAHTELRATNETPFELTVNAGTVKCITAHFTGTMAVATTSTIELTPQFTECTAFGFVSTTVDHNGCNLVFHTEPGTENQEGRASITCPVEKAITVTAFNCWVTIGSQGPLSTFTYTNKNSGRDRDITIDFHLTSVKYTQQSKSFPGCSNGTFTNASVFGAATLEGYHTDGSKFGLWVH